MRIMCVNFLIFVVFVSLSLSLSLNFGKRFWISFVSVCVESSEIFMNRIRFENVYAYTHMYNICVLCIVYCCIVYCCKVVKL